MNKRFPDAARQAFSFLEGVGFKLVTTGSSRLQYETNQVFVMIDWDSRSGEINVSIGLQPREGEPRDAFSLGDILGMQDTKMPERWRPFEVADETQLSQFLEKLAGDTQTYAQAALAGDRMFFHRLRTYRNVKSEVYMLDMKLQRVRFEVDEAWKMRELDKVVGLYTSIENYLTESEKRKLDYAKTH